MQGSTKRTFVLLGAAAAFFGVSGGLAHDSVNDGFVAPNVNYGFTVIGRDTVGGNEDTGYTDVWAHEGYAYIGTFQESCGDAAVFVVDLAAAVANYPGTEGATAARIRSAPNTRVNDLKVHTVGDTDVLMITQTPCGMVIPGSAQSGGNAPAQVGQGGISLYDVSDPTKPKALRKNFLEFGGVYNTAAWDFDGKSFLIGASTSFDFNDVFIVDITKPQSPKLLAQTGALDWVPQGLNLDQLETGSSAGLFAHDVRVEIIDGTPLAVVSYWDIGFVTLDVSDPENPVYIDDSTYPDPEPIVGQPYEGNAHSAVFGSNGDYIFGGDQDFVPASFGISFEGADYPAGRALFGPDSGTLAGAVVWTGGEGCTPADIPAAGAAGQVALVQRGSCFFQDKAESAEAQGYDGYIVANDAARGDSVINMSSRDAGPYPDIPGVFVGYSTGEIMKAVSLGMVSAVEVFDGWGYLHILDNSPGLAHVGYYAPAEAVEDPRPADGLTDFGDLTMHNVEADPLTANVTPSIAEGPRMFVSWYSLGMRAVEYRPGVNQAISGDGYYSSNAEEVGRFIADGGSNFWGVHVDELEIGDVPTQLILGSDRDTGLWIFIFP